KLGREPTCVAQHVGGGQGKDRVRVARRQDHATLGVLDAEPELPLVLALPDRARIANPERVLAGRGLFDQEARRLHAPLPLGALDRPRAWIARSLAPRDD